MNRESSQSGAKIWSLSVLSLGAGRLALRCAHAAQAQKHLSNGPRTRTASGGVV
jgi:hypothetical protein